MRDVIRELHLFTVAQRAVPWAKGSSWAVEGSSAASGIWCLSTQRKLLPAGGLLSPAFFQSNNVLSGTIISTRHSVCRGIMEQKCLCEEPLLHPEMLLGRHHSPPTASAPQHKKPTRWAQTYMQRTIWPAGRSDRHLRPHSYAGQKGRRLRPSECLQGQRHTAPQPLWCPCTKVLRMSSTICFEFCWKHPPLPQPKH